MKAFFAILFLFLLFSLMGCVQEQPTQQQTAGTLDSETSGISDDLTDLSDLQNALDDSAISDSGIDENTFS